MYKSHWLIQGKHKEMQWGKTLSGHKKIGPREQSKIVKEVNIHIILSFKALNGPKARPTLRRPGIVSDPGRSAFLLRNQVSG